MSRERLFQSSDGAPASLTRLATATGASDVADEQIVITAIVSNSSVARDGFCLVSDGMDDTNFRRNPICAFAHDMETPPIGKWSKLWRSGDNIMGNVTFASEAVSPFAAQIGRLYRDGFLNAFSVSFIPLKWQDAKDPARPYARDCVQWELLEISAVPLPSNAAALVNGRAYARGWRASADSNIGGEMRTGQTVETLRRRRAAIYPSTIREVYKDARF